MDCTKRQLEDEVAALRAKAAQKRDPTSAENRRPGPPPPGRAEGAPGTWEPLAPELVGSGGPPAGSAPPPLLPEAQEIPPPPENHRLTLELSPEDLALLETLRAQLQKEQGRALSLGEVLRAALREKALGGAQGEARDHASQRRQAVGPGIAAMLVLYRNIETGTLSIPTRRGLRAVEDPDAYASLLDRARTAELSDLEARAADATPAAGSRYVPVDHQLVVAARSGNRCRFPGCGALAVEWHHLEPHGEGGASQADNLVPLCALHHAAPHSGWVEAHRGAVRTWSYVEPGGIPRARGADRGWRRERARARGGGRRGRPPSDASRTSVPGG